MFLRQQPRRHLQPKMGLQLKHLRLPLLPNPCLHQTMHPYLLWPLHYRLNVRVRLLHRAAQHIQTLRLMMMVLHRFNHVFDDSFLMGLFTLCMTEVVASHSTDRSHPLAPRSSASVFLIKQSPWFQCVAFANSNQPFPSDNSSVTVKDGNFPSCARCQHQQHAQQGKIPKRYAASCRPAGYSSSHEGASICLTS